MKASHIIAAIFVIVSLILFVNFTYQVTFKAGLTGFDLYYGLICWSLLFANAIYELINKLINENRNEPGKDELSKRIKCKANSLAYIISLVLWSLIAVIHTSYRKTVPIDFIIVNGILGMIIIRISCRLYYKFFGNVNE